MEAVLRPLLVYAFLVVVFSLAGKRTLAEMTAFDVVTLLIISEAAQSALIGQNPSLAYALVVIVTLVACSVFMAWMKARLPRIEQAMQGGPLVLVENGRMRRDCMKAAFVDEQDILMSARQAAGLERLDQIKFAILETSGQISVIPKR